MGKFVLLLIFFVLTPITLISTVSLYSYHLHKSNHVTLNLIDDRHIAYAALPPAENVFDGFATLGDSRINLVKSFLSDYHSQLAPFAQDIVNSADKYGIDYRLLPAIAMQETTLCKKTLPQAPFNCWGFGIWGKKVTNFNNFTEAIDTVSHYFGKKKQQGIDSLDEIGKIYNPANTSNWKQNVALFMSKI